DGTAQGTRMVREINPTYQQGYFFGGGLEPGGSNIHDAVQMNGILYFSAADGVHGPELWRSDGIARGTRMVKDIDQDPGAPIFYPGTPGEGAGSNPHELTVAGGRLFFAAIDGVHGDELWVSDGTAAGTRMIRDIWQGTSPLPTPWWPAAGPVPN